MSNVLTELSLVVKDRRDNPQDGSYTNYLFDKGLDKILKKCGEECTEMIIAAKNGDNIELGEEICDLLYHILVLCEEQGLPLNDIYAILEQRRQKIGNLKQMREQDTNT